jgi:predicted metalloprotease
MADAGHHHLAPDGVAPPGVTGRRLSRRGIVFGAMVAAVLVAVAVVVSVSGWPGGLTGTPTAGSVITPDGEGVPIRRVGDATDSAEFTGQEDLVRAVVADLTTFWAAALPPITGRPFTPLRGTLTAMDSTAASGSAPCVASPADIVGNAYYCPSADGIVYDATTLVPVLLHRYGIGGLVTTFAHEFGHAIEARITSAHPGSPAPSPLTVEARADCDAGAFLAWVRAGRAPNTRLGADMMLRAIGPLVDFSDPVTLTPDDPTAHGLAVDRLSWFVEGYSAGAPACVRLGQKSEPLRTTLGQIRDAGSMVTRRFATRPGLLAAAQRSIAAFSPAAAASAHRTDDAAAFAAFVDRVAPHGQFAIASAVALTAAPAADDAPAAACFAGTWVRSVFGHAPHGELGSWPGDADEGLAAVLLAPHASFQSARGYINGFDSGSAAC